jgi:hypothetical protein
MSSTAVTVEAFLPGCEMQRPVKWVVLATLVPNTAQRHYCGRADIRQALGPGWIGLRTDRQYADQPLRAGVGSSLRWQPKRVVSTVRTAASSSSVGEPLTTENTGC